MWLVIGVSIGGGLLLIAVLRKAETEAPQTTANHVSSNVILTNLFYCSCSSE